MDSTHQTIQNLAAEALDTPPDRFIDSASPNSSEASGEELQHLQDRHQDLKTEVNSLLLTAYSNEEIDRIRHLSDLLGFIAMRIQELSRTPQGTSHTTLKQTDRSVSVSELKAQFSTLKEAKTSHGIKAKSWRDLADKLNSQC